VRAPQYRKATLIDRYSADANMVALRLELAAGCPKIAANKIMDLCGVYYPDQASGKRISGLGTAGRLERV
jgi:hypothetical protein